MGFLLDYTGKRWIFKVTFPGWEYIKGQTDRSFGRFILSSLSYRHGHTELTHIYAVSLGGWLTTASFYDFGVLPGFGLQTPLHPALLMAVPVSPRSDVSY